MDFSTTNDDHREYGDKSDADDGQGGGPASEVDVEKLKTDLAALELDLAQLRSELASAEDEVAATDDGHSE